MVARSTIDLSILVLASALACICPNAAGVDIRDLQRGGFLHEDESRFLPGAYYFTKGNEYFHRGKPEAAVRLWMISAGWAMKDAQYNLGIAHFKGEGIPQDRPLGLAWLALAAERKDPQFDESLAAAWDDASPDERERANEIWRDLRKRYADDVALPVAERRFDSELAQITGSRVGMPGSVTVWTRDGVVDGALLRKRLRAEADLYFGRAPRGQVTVGPLQFADAPTSGPDHP